MVRVCVVCSGKAGERLTVFPFPRCSRRRSAWLDALPTLTITSIEEQLLGRKHGVCEQHFIAKDIRRVSSRTILSRKALPARNLKKEVPEKSQSQAMPISDTAKDTSTIQGRLIRDVKKGRWNISQSKRHKPDDSIKVDITDYLTQNSTLIKSPECSQEYKVIESEKSLNERICLVCGRENGNVGLVCALDVDEMNSMSLSVLVAKIVGRTKREVTCISVSMCSRCQSLVQEVAQIEEDLKLKKKDIKEMFEKTLQDQRDKSNDIPDSKDENTDAECSTDFVTYDTTEDKDMSDNFLEDKGNKKHSRRQASSKKYCCPQCKEEFSSLALWVQHLSKHTDAEEQVIQNKPKMVTPKTKKRPVEHACKDCGKTFTCKQTLLTHASTHQQGSDCTVCGRYLTTKARLKVHLFKFHGIGEEPDKEVECQECGKCFGTKAGLRYHRNVVHHVGPKYSCEHCNKIFHYHVPYRSHMLYSHGEKKIICETCGEKFFTISKLNTHINAVHREAQTWVCGTCQMKFTTHTAYRHHVNIKHLQVHHSCDYCPTQFRKRSSLLLHLWKHSVYICHVCRENFTSGESLRSHMSVTHGKEISMKGRRKQTLQNKKLNTQEVIIQKAPVTEHIQQSEQVASIVINDLLMTAESYDNASLPSFSLAPCEKLPEKDTFTNDENMKVKTLTMMDTTQQLPSVDSGPFSTVETLEVKSSNHIVGSEHIEIPSEHIKMSDEHIEIPSEHIKMTSDQIEIPTEHIEIPVPPEHIEIGSEHIEMTSDIKMGSDHIEIGSEHIEMGPGVSLINVQILDEMEMPQGTELGSEDMLSDTHHLTMPLDTHLAEELEPSDHTLAAPVHTLEPDHLEEQTLVVTGTLETDNELEVGGHDLEATHTMEVTGSLESPSHSLEVNDNTLASSSHMEVTEHSLEVNEHPLEVTEHSLEVTEHSLEVVDHSLEVTKHSLEVTEHPLEVTDHMEVTEHPLEVTEHSLEVTDHMEVTELSLEVTEHSLEETEHPLEVTEHPIEVTDHIEVTEHSLEVTEHIEITDHPLEVTEHPLEITEHPLEVTEHSLQVTEHSLEVTEHQIERHCQTLESPAHKIEHLEILDTPNQSTSSTSILPSTSTLPNPSTSTLPPIVEGKEKEEGEDSSLDEFSVTLDGKGELKYQYVMYISAPTEDPESTQN